MADEKALWYVVHTYSGYENKVANDLVKTVENNGMGDLIQEVTVPIEEVVEIRNGKASYHSAQALSRLRSGQDDQDDGELV